MNDLEQQYRRALGWYPRRWRAQHEEALLGILLDQAEAEGRAQMTSADRRNLAQQGLLRRAALVLLATLLITGVLAALQIGSMLSFKQTFDTQLLFSPPPLHPVPVGTSWTPLFTIGLTAGTLYLICGAVLLGSAIGIGFLIWTIRRA